MPQLLAFADSAPLGAADPVVARYMQHMPALNLYREAELPAQAEQIADQLARTPPGRRAVTPFYIMAFALKASEYKVDVVQIYERGWVDVSRDIAGLAQLGSRLERRGVTLDFIYCDLENDLTPWTVGQEPFVQIYKSDAALALMPERLRGFDPGVLKPSTPEYRAWMLEIAGYAQKIRAESLRKALCDSGLMSPWSGATTSGNFNWLRPSFPVLDLNGWGVGYLDLHDNRISCPVAYPGPLGQRYRDRAHHPVWNCFIDCLNAGRSSAAVSEIVPVIREPLRARGQPPGTVDPGGRWLSDQLIGHLTRSGAKRYVMFNAGATAADDQAIARILETHDGATPPEPGNAALPELPLDVDEVVTGGWKTTYTEFLKQEPDRWLAPG